MAFWSFEAETQPRMLSQGLLADKSPWLWPWLLSQGCVPSRTPSLGSVAQILYLRFAYPIEPLSRPRQPRKMTISHINYMNMIFHKVTTST